MILNILDQSPVSEGFSPEDAIRESLDLAIYAEQWGYSRYWLSEHHNTSTFASANPEIMIARIASLTQKIRVGAAGILLGHYSPFKVAETFNLLETLFPGRIDIGIGRSGGADARSIAALNSAFKQEKNFNKYFQLLAYLGKGNRREKAHPTVMAVPKIDRQPEFWVLGSSPETAEFAAENGFRYSFASFINADRLQEAVEIYHESFEPSEYLEKPYFNLAVFGICGDTVKEAEDIALSAELWFIKNFMHGEIVPIPTREVAKNYEFLPPEIMMLERRRESSVVGDKQAFMHKLIKLQDTYSVDEFTIITLTHDYEDRKKSYKLAAEATGIFT